jgi:hypothetical protein
MAKSILAVPPCSHNPTPSFYQDTARLSELLLQTYQYHIDRSVQETATFIEKLQQLVALGYKACRQSLYRRSYHVYRQQFLQYDEGDFRKHLSLVDTLANGLAKMVQWAIQGYASLNYPENYEAFLQLLEDVLKPEKMVSISQQEAAYQLLEELKQLY